MEIKSFLGISALHEFYKAVGQFDYYLFSLQKQEQERKLFLAVPEDFFIEFIEQDSHNLSYIQDRKLNVIVFDIQHQRIIKWIQYHG